MLCMLNCIGVIELSWGNLKKPITIILIIATIIVAGFGIAVMIGTPELAVLGILIVLCAICIIALVVICLWVYPSTKQSELDYMAKAEEICRAGPYADMARVRCEGRFRINDGNRLVCQMEFTPVYVVFIFGGRPVQMSRDKIQKFQLRTVHELILTIDGLGEFSFLCNDVCAIDSAVHLLKMYTQ